MDHKQRISKGFYQHTQKSDFVSVKNYIFLHQPNKQYLLIRFSNDSDFKITAMEFVLLQLDATGAILDRTTIKYNKMAVDPGREYVPTQGIRVNKNCCDFRIVYKQVRSDQFCYRPCGNDLVVHYERKKQRAPLLSVLNYVDPIFSVKPLSLARPGLFALIALAVFLLCVALNFQHMHTAYAEIIEEQRQEQQQQEPLEALPVDTPVQE